MVVVGSSQFIILTRPCLCHPPALLHTANTSLLTLGAPSPPSRFTLLLIPSLTPPPPSPRLPLQLQEDDRSIDTTLLNYQESGGAASSLSGGRISSVTATLNGRANGDGVDPPAAAPAATRPPSPAEAAASAAAAAATSAGFDVTGKTKNGSGQAGVEDPGADEARTIVLERCAALVRSYGLRKQAIAVDNLLESMEKAGVQMNARFLNSALVRSLRLLHMSVPSSSVFC